MIASQKPTKNKASRPVPSDPTAAPSTEGRRLLQAVDASLSEVAKRVGVSKALVGFWRAGSKTPTPEMRRVLATLYSIPVAAWDSRVGATPTTAAPARREEAQATNRAGAEQLLAEILAQRSKGDLATREFVQLCDAETRTRALIERMEQAEQLTETRILQSPVMTRIRSAAFASLQPYPDALRAFLEAIGAPVSA